MAQEIAGHLLTASLKPDVWTIEGFVPGPRGEFQGDISISIAIGPCRRILSTCPMTLNCTISLNGMPARSWSR